jgi:hypothetical protein
MGGYRHLSTPLRPGPVTVASRTVFAAPSVATLEVERLAVAL